MDPRTRKLIVFGAFIASVIYGAVNLIGTPQPSAPPAPEPVRHEIQATPVSKASFIDIEKYSALDWGSDPFCRDNNNNRQAQMPIQPETPAWILGGILYDDLQPAAIVNGHIVRRGEIINGARVTRIDKNRVTLEKDGSEFSLSIAKDKS